MDPAVQAVDDAVESLVQALRLARALAQAERPLKLEGLDRQVGLACAKAVDLPCDMGRRLRGRLIALLTEVDAVTDLLRRQQSARG